VICWTLSGGGVEGLDAAAKLNQLAFGEGRNPLRDPTYRTFVGYSDDDDSGGSE
jgi:hypothetical protein